MPVISWNDESNIMSKIQIDSFLVALKMDRRLLFSNFSVKHLENGQRNQFFFFFSSYSSLLSIVGTNVCPVIDDGD